MKKPLSILLVFLLLLAVCFSTLNFASGTIIFSDGFEDGTFDAWTNSLLSSGVIAVTTENPYNGTYSVNATCTADGAKYALYYKLIAGANDYYASAWVYFDSDVSLSNGYSNRFLGLLDYSTQTIDATYFNDGGTLKWSMAYRNASTITRVNNDTASAPVADSWYWVKVFSNCSSANDVFDGSAHMWVYNASGYLVASLSAMNLDTDVTVSDAVIMGRGRTPTGTGQSTSAGTNFVDEVVVSDVDIEFPLTDSTAPTYSGLSASTTVSGASCQLNATFNDETDLTTTGGYILEFGGSNSTWTAFSSTPETISETVTLTNTVGATDTYNWYFNDTAGNWNSTGTQSIVLTADTYTVTLTANTLTPSTGETITVDIAVSRALGIAVSSYIMNVTRSGGLEFENYTDASFTSSESSVTTHTFNVTGLIDVDSGASVTPTCAGLTVVWSSPSSSTYNPPADSEPTPAPSDAPSGGEQGGGLLPTISPDIVGQIALVAFIAVVAVVGGYVYVGYTGRNKKTAPKKKTTNTGSRKKPRSLV